MTSEIRKEITARITHWLCGGALGFCIFAAFIFAWLNLSSHVAQLPAIKRQQEIKEIVRAPLRIAKGE